MRVLALLALIAAAAAQEVRLDLMLSPVGGDRSEAEIAALEPLVAGWIDGVLTPRALRPAVVAGQRPERQAQVRRRVDCAVVEDERPERVTQTTLRLFDSFSNQRPPRPVWSGTVERAGPLEDAAPDLEALLTAAVAGIGRP